MNDLIERLKKIFDKQKAWREAANHSVVLTVQEFEETLAALQQYEGLLHEAASFLCDHRAGLAANDLAERIIANLSPTGERAARRGTVTEKIIMNSKRPLTGERD